MSSIMDKVWDLAGVGFGPANLSIVVNYENRCRKKAIPENEKLSAIFVEKRPRFDWHPGLLMDDAEMQVSFLKDLITLRDPTSEFTFLNYLRSTGQLLEFVNLRSFYALRTEFRDYMRWVASALSEYVLYGTTVINVEPNTVNGRVHSLTVHTRDASGGEDRIFAKNLAVAIGGTPRWPKWLDKRPCSRVFHSSEFLQALRATYADTLQPYSFVVVGAGQSSAEMFRHLHASYPNAVITLVIAGFALRPADDSEFVNEIFDPTMVDFFYHSSDCERRKLMSEYDNTNYAVVDHDLIRAIYREIYLSKRTTGRLRLIRGHRLVDVEPLGNTSRLTLRSDGDGRKSVVDADGVFLGSGYEYARTPSIIRDLAPYFESDQAGDPIVKRDYSIKCTSNFQPRIYLQGPTEASHGLTSTLLSVLPFRADDILDSIAQTLKRAIPPDVAPERPLANPMPIRERSAEQRVVGTVAHFKGDSS
jgi:L-ornithine N5-oxygenase